MNQFYQDNVNLFRLSREVPTPGLYPKGGILADEMGLGKNSYN